MKIIPTWQEDQARIDPEEMFAQRKWMQDEIDALRARLAVCEPLVEHAKGVFDNCNVTAGVCMCGDDEKSHNAHANRGFVDMGEYNVNGWTQDYYKAFPKPEEPTDG